ncbi:MAG TPA: aminotransferase class I/II-fold pyridoxal phosphate-dependent enzyme [bacterium]|nr:aminotransferase class I/II-fold pyridoxal phosphate-dependent enzyme [bacterium]
MPLQTEANLIKKFPPYLFARLNAEKLAARHKGEDVIDMSMGNPDNPTPQPIVDKLIEVVRDKKSHRYSTSKGIPAFLKAVSRWYDRKYGVSINPYTEAVSVIGSKEGLAHLGLAVINRGDKVITPTPTYPIHHYSVIIAGGTLVPVSILNGPEAFLKNVEKVYAKSKPRPKILIINFPHNPTTTCVDQEFFKEIVQWAKKRQVLVVHDLAYADIVFDGYKSPSFLATPGAKDIGVEAFTLSKSYNMAGWRVGFVAGNPKVVASLAKIKSYMDYGIFTPIQVAAITALDSPEENLRKLAAIYQERRDIMADGLNRMGWPVEKPKAAMYLWAKIPQRFAKMSSMDFAMMLLKDAAVSISPGSGFGAEGEGYVRMAMVENKDRIRQALRNIRKLFS